MTEPVTVIVARDARFYDQRPILFPHSPAKKWFTSSPEFSAETALGNVALQSAYLMLAFRALGLDTGPVSGFKRDVVDSAFLTDTGWKSDLLINVGYRDRSKLFDRLPRLEFSKACRII